MKRRLNALATVGLSCIILKSNTLRYVLIEYSQLQKEETIDEKEVEKWLERYYQSI